MKKKEVEHVFKIDLPMWEPYLFGIFAVQVVQLIVTFGIIYNGH